METQPAKVLHQFADRNTQHIAGEMIGAFSCVVSHRDILCGGLLLHFVDNPAALAGLVWGHMDSAELVAIAKRRGFAPWPARTHAGGTKPKEVGNSRNTPRTMGKTIRLVARHQTTRKTQEVAARNQLLGMATGVAERT